MQLLLKILILLLRIQQRIVPSESIWCKKQQLTSLLRIWVVLRLQQQDIMWVIHINYQVRMILHAAQKLL